MGYFYSRVIEETILWNQRIDLVVHDPSTGLTKASKEITNPIPVRPLKSSPVSEIQLQSENSLVQ
jgi:hypothetical protein